MKPYQYWAFISYSHGDRRWAQWLHRRIEGFRIPRVLRAGIAIGLKRDSLSPLFIDHAELPAGHSLEAAIKSALDASLFLIVVASPAAVRSAHVTAEIDYFLAHNSRDRILTLIVDGRPNATLRGHPPEEECFPLALRTSLSGNAIVEVAAEIPFGADARGGRPQRAQALRRMAAGLLKVSYETLYRRDLRRFAARATIAMLAALATVIIILMPTGRLERLWLRTRGLVSFSPPDELRSNAHRWEGTWMGTISSTCDNYSGPITEVIEVAGSSVLRVRYKAGPVLKGSYTLTQFDTSAVSNDIPGAAHYFIAGDTITIQYPAACQTGELTRQ